MTVKWWAGKALPENGGEKQNTIDSRAVTVIYAHEEARKDGGCTRGSVETY
jgi:hypothetical protein